MKKIIISLSFLMMAISLSAQRPDIPANEEMEAYQIAFFTRKLDLTTEEAQKFWPLFNAYKAEEREIKKSLRIEMQQEVETEEEAIKKLEVLLERETAILEHKRKYAYRFQQALPAVKVFKFFKVEREFVNLVLKRLSKRRENRLRQ